jgi:hypothetical protein
MLLVTSCWLAYHIIDAHSADCPHVKRMAAGSDEQCPSNKLRTLYIGYLEASLKVKVTMLSTTILKVNNLEEIFTL